MFRIKMADLLIEIDNKHDYVYHLCKDYIDTTHGKNCDLLISVTDEQIMKEQESSEAGCTLEYCECICIYREISRKILGFGGFVMHRSEERRVGKEC